MPHDVEVRLMGSGSGSATKSTGRSSWAVRKARTRQALIDVALELFAAQGYESTSIEQIADRAGVSPRTFFRYFVTKESVLFFGEDDYVRSLVEDYVAQTAAQNEM
jgi:AcrR family transcriptional regulator